MSAGKHTPGPWRFNAILTASENDRGWNIVRDHAGVGGFVGTVSPRIKGNRGDASEEGISNARLIAAAPMLLERLKDAAAVMRANGLEISATYAEDAIRAATGEQA